MAIQWSNRMDYVLRRVLRTFGRSTSYQRSGYAAFAITGILDVDPRLETVDYGKFYGVTYRLADFATASFRASVTLTFTGLPGSGNTVTFDGVTYTFRNIITELPNDVQRGSTEVECAQYLTAAINADPAQAGLIYSETTVAHPTCTAAQDSQSVRVSAKAAGMAGSNLSAAENLNNATLSSKLFTGGGPLTSDEVTIDGLTYKVGDVGFDAEGGVQLRLHVKTS